ncbi:MAG: DNA primase [Syntrophaceticus sp.]|nr:DNA primase [Syntrophaceticus sp.]MDD4783533.1 DNA primase [Syntrophaceticus sp.]
MGSVSDEFLDRVRSGIDIVDLISEYVSLKKTGQNYMGLCPFHQEKTPSFSVSSTKQIFHCFGCGVGGDVFSFLMKINNLSFPEAVETLAERIGLEVPRSPGSRKRYERKERFYDLNAHAAEYYHRILISEDSAESARNYLLGRGIKQSTWKRFQLGFAPPSGSSLLDAIRKNGFSLNEIHESGLFTERYGIIQERFRGRIIFPICDARGRCLGFGGRALGEEQPKYLNSPESPVFNKRQNLYGLHLAIPAVRQVKKVIVVEGYMDCIAVQEYGFGNTVAALGTAFTNEQSRLLLRYAKDIILAFDQDTAGLAATMRSAGVLQELGAQVSVLGLSDAKDPDEFLQTYGREAFAAALEERTTSYLEFRLEQLLHRYNPENVYARAEIVMELARDLAEISNYVVREGFIQMAAQKLHTSEEAIRLELSRFSSKQSASKDKTVKNRDNMEQGKQTFGKERLTASEAARTGLIRLMCEDRSILQQVQDELGAEMVFTGKLKDYCELFENPDWESPAELISQVASGSQEELVSLLMSGEEIELDKAQQERLVDDYILTLKRERLSQIIQAKQATLREYEKNGDQEGIKGLLAELNVLYEKLEQVKLTQHRFN